MGCSPGGYLFCRPMPVEDVQAFIERAADGSMVADSDGRQAAVGATMAGARPLTGRSGREDLEIERGQPCWEITAGLRGAKPSGCSTKSPSSTWPSRTCSRRASRKRHEPARERQGTRSARSSAIATSGSRRWRTELSAAIVIGPGLDLWKPRRRDHRHADPLAVVAAGTVVASEGVVAAAITATAIAGALIGTVLTRWLDKHHAETAGAAGPRPAALGPDAHQATSAAPSRPDPPLGRTTCRLSAA